MLKWSGTSSPQRAECNALERVVRMVSQTNCTSEFQNSPMIEARVELESESEEVDPGWIEVEKVVLM